MRAAPATGPPSAAAAGLARADRTAGVAPRGRDGDPVIACFKSPEPVRVSASRKRTGLSDLKRGHKKGTARANSCSSEVSEPVVNLERTVDDSEYGGRPGPGSTRLPNRS